MTLEGKVALLVSYLKVGILDQDILECKLLIVSQINMRTVTVTGKVLISVIQTGFFVINEVAVCACF